MQFSTFNFSKKQNNRLKTVLKVGILLLVLTTFISYFGKIKIEEKIAEIAGLECEKINVNILLRKASLGNLTYQWNGASMDSSSLACKTIQLKGISWWQLLVHNQLKVRVLSVGNVQGNINGAMDESEETEAKTKKEPQLKSIYIDDIFLEKVNINFDQKEKFKIKLGDLRLHFNQLKYDFEDIQKALTYQGFEMSFENGKWIPYGGNHYLESGKMQSNMEEKDFEIKDLIYKKFYDRERTNTKDKKERLHFKAKSIVGSDLDYQKLIAGEGVFLKNLTLDNSNLDVFVKKKRKPCESCYKAFLHEKLIKAKLPVHIEKVELKNNGISIDIENVEKEKMAHVDFEKIYASVYHISNIEEQIKTNPKIIADVQTLFMGEEKLETQIKCNLNDPQYGYEFKATLDKMNLLVMNDVLEFGTKARVKSGDLKSLTMQVKGNQEVSTGTMNFQYENLEVELLREKKIKVKKFLSKVINKLAIQKSNKKSEGNFKEGKIYFLRNKNKGLFAQWWGAIQSGFQSTILPKILLPKELK